MLQPRSGAGPTRKNDGRTSRSESNELVEFKRTDNLRSITLLFTDLRDLERHALAEGRYGILVFELAGRNYVVHPQEDHIERVHRPRERVSPASKTRRRDETSLSQMAPKTRMVREGEVFRNRINKRPQFDNSPRQSVFRRVSGQRTDREGQTDMQRNRFRGGQGVPSKGTMPPVGVRQRREVRNMGGSLRAGTAGDEKGDGK